MSTDQPLDAWRNALEEATLVELQAIEVNKAHAGLGEYDAWLKYVLRGFRWACGCYIGHPPAVDEPVAAYKARLFALMADLPDDLRPADRDGFSSGLSRFRIIAEGIPEGKP